MSQADPQATRHQRRRETRDDPNASTSRQSTDDGAQHAEDEVWGCRRVGRTIDGSGRPAHDIAPRARTREEVSGLRRVELKTDAKEQRECRLENTNRTVDEIDHEYPAPGWDAVAVRKRSGTIPTGPGRGHRCRKPETTRRRAARSVMPPRPDRRRVADLHAHAVSRPRRK